MKRVTFGHAQVIGCNATTDLATFSSNRDSDAMADSPRTPQTLPEWELPNHQRGLVDDIIEEGQYEAAIEALFQLRSPQYKPSMQVAFVASLCGSSSRLHPLQNTYPAAGVSRPPPSGDSSSHK
jgi:hypothetical protein